MSTRDTVTIEHLAVRFDASVSWVRKHWREIEGLPRPFIGAGKHQHAKWRRADIDAFMKGKVFDALPLAGKTQADTPDAGEPIQSSIERRSRLLQGAGSASHTE